MKCEKTHRKMLDLLDGELPDHEEHKVQEHLRECDKCDAEMQVLESGDRYLRSFVDESNLEREFLTPSRMDRLEKELGSNSKILSLRRLGSIAAAAAAIIVVIIMLPSWLSAPGAKRGRPPYDAAQQTGGDRSPAPAPAWEISYVDDSGTTDHDPLQVSTTRAREMRADNSSQSRQRRFDGYRKSENNVYVPVEAASYGSNRDEQWW